MAKTATNLIITGLPRSGTSFLCARVNDFPNTVVINEPAEIILHKKSGCIDGIVEVFGEYRRNISEGKPVLNKIKAGKFIEDTGLEDNRALHRHSIDNERFTLGIKNTLIFLALLPEIVQSNVFPKIIATIRNPYDCIGSWHNVDFPHLRQAKPFFLLEYAGETFSEYLVNLLSEEDLVSRSAKLWSLLAMTMWKMKGKIHIVRYEDMIAKPEITFQRISDYLGFTVPEEKLPQATRPVRRGDVFSKEQKSTIAAVCNKLAASYGYRMK